MTPVMLIVLVLGVFVTGATLVGAFLIGLTEAADTAHAKPGDLTQLERTMVNREEGRIDV
jgi:hypothetical protein